LCPDADFIAQVEASIAKLLPTMTRKTIIAKALKERGALIHTKDITEARGFFLKVINTEWR
jgi:histidinol dehydrogenase